MTCKCKYLFYLSLSGLFANNYLNSLRRKKRMKFYENIHAKVHVIKKNIFNELTLKFR